MNVAVESRVVEVFPVRQTVPSQRVEVRPVVSGALFEQMCRDRRKTYAALGVELHDDVLDAVRRFGTTLGVFVDGRLVGGFSCWRLSEGLCSLGFTLQRLHLERYQPDRTVELGSMYVLPEYQGRGAARALKEAGRVLLVGMKPELLVAFAVDHVVDLYVMEFGFRRVGPPVEHPLARGVKVTPLAATFKQFAKRHYA